MSMWWNVAKVDDRWHKVRQELAAVGLLGEGEYLDCIELELTWLPSFGEAGFVYDSGVSMLASLAGCREGVIYLPADTPEQAYVPGGTLTDTIRHEYGHAWAWLDRPFFRQPWFRRAFGREYDDEWPLGEALWSIFGAEPDEFRRSPYYDEYVTPYAMYGPYEDLAETFMTFLRYRASLGKYRARTGVYRKLMAVRSAVARASRERG